MKPIIGITADKEDNGKHVVKETYIQAVIRAGGLPAILPSSLKEEIHGIIQRFDGFLLTGGGDIDPTLFGEEPHVQLGNIEPDRDTFEIALVKAIMPTKKPFLGICRGMQIMNIAMGGNMYQDIYAQQKNTFIQHSQKAPASHASHFVQLKDGCLIKEIADAEKIKVNSFHHQAVKDVPNSFRVSGIANDGTIEAIESAGHPFALGVQWHPEGLAQKGDQFSLRLFEQFIKRCKESGDKV